MKIRENLKSYDLFLISVFVLLLIFGVGAVASASYPEGLKELKPYGYLTKHIAFLLIGSVATVLAAHFPRKNLRKLSPFIFIFALFLVALLFTKFGTTVKGQTRWLKIKNTPISIQPGDVMKVASVIFLSNFLTNNIKKITDFNTFVTILVIMALAVIPMAVKDLSTAIVIGSALFLIFYCAGMKSGQFLLMAIMGGFTVLLMLMTDSNKYRRDRIIGYFQKGGSGLDQLTYQPRQSLYAIAMGGYTGVGFFHSRQKFGNLPEPETDFIFSVICEELGLFGALVLILLFVLLIYRCFMIAYKSEDTFDKLLGIGLSTYLAIQTFFHIGVGIKLLPVTGITLPFISYGGSSLIMSMISIGLILRISRDNRGVR